MKEWISVSLAYADGDPIDLAEITADGRRVVSGSKGGRVTVWAADSEVSVTTPSPERELYELHDHDAAVRFIEFFKSEEAVITGAKKELIFLPAVTK